MTNFLAIVGALALLAAAAVLGIGWLIRRMASQQLMRSIRSLWELHGLTDPLARQQLAEEYIEEMAQGIATAPRTSRLALACSLDRMWATGFIRHTSSMEALRRALDAMGR